MKSSDGERGQSFVITDEEIRQQRRGEVGGRGEEKTGAGNDDEAFFENAFELFMTARAVVVAHDRRGSHGVTDENRFKEEGDVHDYAESGDAVCPGDGDELIVVDHGNEGHGNICQEFR